MSKSSDPTIANLGKVESDTKTDKDVNQFDAASFEQSNVHSVYEAIANHFSDTRYNLWPLIPTFIESLPKGSIGADLGCGNGKYLHLRNVVAPSSSSSSSSSSSDSDLMIIGMDRSSNLLDLAKKNFGFNSSNYSDLLQDGNQHTNEVAVGDAMYTNFRSETFDFVISIATIHHFSSFERRIKSIEEMIRIIKPITQQRASKSNAITIEQGPYAGLRSGSARFLIVVWALEQRGQSRRQFENVTPEKQEEDDGKALEDGRDLLVPWVLKEKKKPNQDNVSDKNQQSPQVYQRFYHVFQQGELEKTVEEAAKRFPHLDIQHELGGWEKGNWYGIWKCVEKL